MSIFDKIFNDSNPKFTTENGLDWKALTEIKQLDEIVTESSVMPVFIFKHSTRCGISRMVLRKFEIDYQLDQNEITPYFLDLLAYRDISNEISRRFGVMHQSPQLLLIKDGKCVYADSHGEIDAETLKEKIRL